MPRKEFDNENYHLCSSECPDSPAYQEHREHLRRARLAIKEGRSVLEEFQGERPSKTAIRKALEANRRGM